MIQDSSNSHSQYPDFSRHWCDTSERFAGGDALLTAMNRNWEVEPTCYEEHVWHAGTRLVTIYHFTLHNEGETLLMPVVANPYVQRVVREQGYKVLPFEEAENLQSRYEGDN